MCSSGMPEAPDASELIQLGTQSNQDTAAYSAGLNAVNQVNPFGSSTYSVVPGANGEPDSYTLTQTLNPDLQAAVDWGSQGLNYLSQAGLEQAYNTAMGGLEDISTPTYSSYGAAPSLSTGLGDYSDDAQKYEDALFSDLDEEKDKDYASLETELANKGISTDSDAYSRAMDDFNEGVSTDRTNAILAAGDYQTQAQERALNTANFGNTATQQNFENDTNITGLNNAVNSQAFQDAITGNAAEINNALGLTSGASVPMPSFASTPTTGVAGVDAAGISQGAYDDQMNQYLAGQQQLGGIFGALGSLGSSLLTLSDPKLKTDKHKIGETDDGLGIYSFKYRGSNKTSIGLMADEVERAKPDAVHRIGGIRFVDYGQAVGA